MKDSIKKIPTFQRPREKAIKNGINSLSDSELLALILRCGNKKLDVLDLSSLIMRKYINFNNLVNADYQELIKIEGIKQAKAIEIKAIMEIVKRIQNTKISTAKKIVHPKEIYDYFSPLLINEKQENFIVIFMDIKLQIIKYETLFVGGTNCSIIDINLILKKSLCLGAKKIICLHNHPSGDPLPSSPDINITKKLEKNSNILDIELLDHIIIGKEKYFSFKENKILL